MTVIEAVGLGKSFGAKRAVDDLSFRVRPGKVTGLLGPNGSGKSTTIRLMLGLTRGSGTTTFDGRRYQEIDRPARSVGVMLDARAFHPTRTVRDHLSMVAAGIGVPPARVTEVLELVGLAAEARSMPKRFSLGMNQRLGIATALLGEPETLILDEPANGLDPQGIRWLRLFLRRYAAAGRTVLVSSHLLAEMEQTADELLVIARGRLVRSSSVQEFIGTSNLTVVHVRAKEPDRLATLLRGAGATVKSEPEDLLVVQGMGQRDIGDLAFRESIAVYEIVTRTATLEEAFLAASDGLTDYDARPVDANGARR
ncbi:ATP-binding cassette domain-containing protein [Solwaraspora sp. WMMD1047]|uniref:ATP-binding cassette domain-containing protein n=1 Tax=Solwaraspora sp. WMMD1047 TaxID=3016102 RepID=UPI00241603C4|nr:ATP-binding cassette domain-containing protein [Solwaraspora sp. WMMD1047]MDG4832684.1 ATP-binding cassette domain-containing protein [Solwaraspora sp. WMMD1047]